MSPTRSSFVGEHLVCHAMGTSFASPPRHRLIFRSYAVIVCRTTVYLVNRCLVDGTSYSGSRVIWNSFDTYFACPFLRSSTPSAATTSASWAAPAVRVAAAAVRSLCYRSAQLGTLRRLWLAGWPRLREETMFKHVSGRPLLCNFVSVLAVACFIWCAAHRGRCSFFLLVGSIFLVLTLLLLGFVV